jgi:hypothetical protein
MPLNGIIFLSKARVPQEVKIKKGPYSQINWGLSAKDVASLHQCGKTPQSGCCPASSC